MAFWGLLFVASQKAFIIFQIIEAYRTDEIKIKKEGGLPFFH
jgi:hypothetical protein